MGFCYWNASGEPKFDQLWRLHERGNQRMEFDGIVYPVLGITDVSVGYAKAPIKVQGWPSNRGTQYEKAAKGFPGVVVAGTAEKRVSPGAPEEYEAALKLPVGNRVSPSTPDGYKAGLKLHLDNDTRTGKRAGSVDRAATRMYSQFPFRKELDEFDEP
jgi:hypothetical protein